jgi:transcriptional regulator with XRE-family HTH domain
MNMDENIYGKSVRKARLKRGFSQAEMAEMLDISRNYLSLIETGAKVPKKSLRTIELVADKAGNGLFTGGQGFKQAALAMGQAAFA